MRCTIEISLPELRHGYAGTEHGIPVNEDKNKKAELALQNIFKKELQEKLNPIVRFIENYYPLTKLIQQEKDNFGGKYSDKIIRVKIDIIGVAD